MKNNTFRKLDLKEMKEILDKMELKEEYPHFITKELDDAINREILKQIRYDKEKDK